MRMDGLFVALMVFGPALLGLGALIAGLTLLLRHREDEQPRLWHALLGSCCLLIALGIGGCYATMFLGRG
jgi:hypothetical protein